MSNADNELIPFLHDDQGEGIKDFFMDTVEAKEEQANRRRENFMKRLVSHDDPVYDEMEDLKMGVAEFAFMKRRSV